MSQRPAGYGAKIFRNVGPSEVPIWNEINVKDLTFQPGELRFEKATAVPRILQGEFEVTFDFTWNGTRRWRELNRRRLRRAAKKFKHRQWLRARQ